MASSRKSWVGASILVEVYGIHAEIEAICHCELSFPMLKAATGLGTAMTGIRLPEKDPRSQNEVGGIGLGLD